MKKRLITIVVPMVVAVAVALAAIAVYNRAADKKGGVKEMAQQGTQTEKTETKEEQQVENEATKDGASQQEEIKTEDTTEDDKIYTPTFMYFVTNADEEATKAMIDELKSEYDGRVTFDIKNVDKDPELKKNFEFVDGNTPALIMLDTHNNISMFELKCTDKEKLKTDIENALNA